MAFDRCETAVCDFVPHENKRIGRTWRTPTAGGEWKFRPRLGKRGRRFSRVSPSRVKAMNGSLVSQIEREREGE
jgi:hypothetical protein